MEKYSIGQKIWLNKALAGVVTDIYYYVSGSTVQDYNSIKCEYVLPKGTVVGDDSPVARAIGDICETNLKYHYSPLGVWEMNADLKVLLCYLVYEVQAACAFLPDSELKVT